MRGFVIGLMLSVCGAAWGYAAQDQLFQAIRNNDLAFLQAQLGAGADINTRDRRGTTLLMHAAAFGSAEAVEMLLAKGADVNAKNALDATALILGGSEPRKARLLIEKGADVNAASKLGRTPLMIAAACDGCSETIRLLIAKGAKVNAKDGHGGTALTQAAWANDFDTMKLLIEAGAEPDVPDSAESSPLGFAAPNCNVPGIKLLLSKGADVNRPNLSPGEVKFGNIQLIHVTPLMWAAPFCSAETIKTLLDAGAKVNEKDIRGMTPLMLAVASERQNPAVVRLLLKAGADVNAKSTMGETVLDWARKFGNPEVIRLLTEAGARESRFTPPVRASAPARPPAEAVARGTALLERSAAEFFHQSGCVGCHHQMLTSLAASAARSAGIHVDENAARERLNMMTSEVTREQETILERVDTGGASDAMIYILLAMSAERVPPSTVTDTLVQYVVSRQMRDGTWRLGGIPRAPIEDGIIGRTALSIRALQLYGTPALKAAFELRIARARDFLLEAKAETNDDAALQLAGLNWAGIPAGKLRALARPLLAAQRADGGWAQNQNLASDAYATGETLWALRETGMLKPSDPAYQRGVKYLLSTQWEDGSWYVRSRAVKFQPYFQSGFPFDHDQWISSAATAWSIMALAPAAENERRASR